MLGADEAAEAGHVAEQERRQAEAAVDAVGAVRREGQLAGAVRIARDAQVVRAPDVDAGLEGVAADQLGHVADELQLVLVLFERAVAAVGVEAGAEDEPAVAVAIDVAGRQAGGEGVVQVQPGNAGVGGRRGAVVERQHVDVVAEEAEAEVGQQRARERVVDAVREALVLDVRDAAEADELAPAAGAERGRAVAQELAAAVAAERVGAAPSRPSTRTLNESSLNVSESEAT